MEHSTAVSRRAGFYCRQALAGKIAIFISHNIIIPHKTRYILQFPDCGLDELLVCDWRKKLIYFIEAIWSESIGANNCIVGWSPLPCGPKFSELITLLVGSRRPILATPATQQTCSVVALLVISLPLRVIALVLSCCQTENLWNIDYWNQDESFFSLARVVGGACQKGICYNFFSSPEQMLPFV